MPNKTKIVEVDATVSDLFFNHEHLNYDALFSPGTDGPDRDEMRDAIYEDAKEFVESYEHIVVGCPTAEALRDDFMSRL